MEITNLESMEFLLDLSIQNLSVGYILEAF